MERIGGDRICDSALTAASNMMVPSSPEKLSREVDTRTGFGKGSARAAQASSGLPRTFGPNVAIAMITMIIAVEIRPNTPPTPASRKT